MKRGGYLKRRTRLRSMSARRRAELSDRRVVVAEALARDRGCVAAGSVAEVRCGGPLDAHEVIPRSAWRDGWLVLGNIVTVCRAHHDWIGAHPDEAHVLGLHGYSWEVDR